MGLLSKIKNHFVSKKNSKQVHYTKWEWSDIPVAHYICSLDIYEKVIVVEYKEKWGMQFVDIDNSDKIEEKLIKSFPLTFMNPKVGPLYNYKERSYDPDNWCRDVTFDVLISDELREFLKVAKTIDDSANSTTTALLTGEHIPSRLEKELKFFAESHLYGDEKIMGFRFAGGGEIADEYRLEETSHYIVKLKVEK